MRSWLALAAVSFSLLCTGCRQSASAHVRDADLDPPITQTYAQTLVADVTQHELAPADLAALHQAKGLGLGLEMDGRRFHAGQDIPLLLVYEDIAATGPVSSTDCRGFSITVESLDQGRSDLAPLQPCLADAEPAETNVALVKNTVRFLHSSLYGARLELTQPGKYLIRATWQSYRPRGGGFRKQDMYARVHSNVIPFVVTP